MSTWEWLALGAAGLVLLAARTRALWAPLGDEPAPVELDDGSAEAGQGGGFSVDAFMASFDPLAYTGSWGVSEATEQANVSAFLATIRKAEGTAGPDGYRTLFGGALFTSYADHPRQAKRFTDKAGRRLWTSAAGAYQFMAVSPIPAADGSPPSSTKVDTWDRLQAKLELADFSPASQDAAAIELIREAGALDDVKAGRFDQAVAKVRRTWASLPGAGYAQPEKSIESLRVAFTNAGGTITA